ncbi:MAG: septal ring lytic transglycosylase RlpA family protein [Xanthobacteraceae bacterium]
MGIGHNRLAFRRIAPNLALAGACLVLANCSPSAKFAGIDPRFGVASSERVVDTGVPVPKGGGVYRVGKPYQVAGRTYVPEDGPGYVSEGLASWYGNDFHGRRTANGEVYDMEGLSAAHPTLPMPSYVRVTNLHNHRSIILRVNDRGPYHGNRVVDVSKRAAHLLGFRGNGVARVRVEYVGPASLDGSDDHLLAATLREGEPAPSPSLVMLASSRPFLPQAAARSPVIRGEVPVPSDRPYTLGEASASASAASFDDRFSAVPATPVRSSFMTR